MKMTLYVISMKLFIICFIAYTNTIYVPSDYTKIQDAISASSSGDTIIVGQGTYIENLDFLGKDITVKSRLGPEVTIIDANMTDSGVVFINGETDKAILDGFTITNGCGHPYFSTKKYEVGGGVYCLDSCPRIVNNIIIKNKCNCGGGIACFGSKSEPEIYNCYIAENEVINISGSMGYGGGIGCFEGVAKILNCEIKCNICTFIGGGIFATGSAIKGKPLIKNNIIQDNIAVSKGGGSGGGIGCKNGPKPHIENNIISGNIACGGGGIGVYDAKIINNLIINNVAEDFSDSGAGGGIVTCGFYTEICNNTIINNTALTEGGGISWWAYSGKIKNNIICYNKASGDNSILTVTGGGLSFMNVSGAGKTVVSNCIIANNLSDEYGGGVGFYYKSAATMVNNTIYANKADISGSGIYVVKTSNLTLQNSIVYDNINDEIGHDNNPPIVTYSNIKGGWPGTGNIDSDPMFADPFNLDFHIKYNSPCRDTGNKTLLDLPSFDFENDPRIAWGEADMGADEFYNHLYIVGLPSHGKPIDVKITGQPGPASLWLCLSMSAKQIPQNTKWGDWYLEYPLTGPVLLGQIPTIEGVYVLSGVIPTSPPDKYNFHMQALIGQDLTNCCTVRVK